MTGERNSVRTYEAAHVFGLCNKSCCGLPHVNVWGNTHTDKMSSSHLMNEENIYIWHVKECLNWNWTHTNCSSSIFWSSETAVEISPQTQCIYTHLLKKKTYFEKVTFLTDSLYTTTDFFIYLFIWKHKVELILFSYIFIQMHCFFCDSGVVKSLWLIQCYAVDCHYVIFSKLVSLDIQCLLCK